MNSRANSGISALVACLIPAALLGCGGEDASGAEQARALLDKIARLDLNGPHDERARRIEQLRALALTDPQLARVRDACALAHAGLLAAESEQAAVRKRLDQPRDAAISQAELTLMAAQVQQASQRLRDARSALPECDTQTRALLERHR
jgi:hypothetical protein